MNGTNAKRMILRADHVAGAAFVAFGAAIIALSGDLPVGALSMPGAGFLPMIVATLTIVFGLALILRATAESPPFAELDWADGKHALMVTAITAAGILLYERLGFFVTMLLTLMALLTIVERRNPVRAGIFCVLLVGFTYASFVYGLKTPLPEFSF
jgi:Tripartite tricarboxylate transporter TctB family